MGYTKRGNYLFDLDQSLVEYHEFQGAAHIGPPIKAICDLVRLHLEEGYEVRLFTARACLPPQELEEFAKEWAIFSNKEFGQVLEITNKKDFETIAIYDDRAKQIVGNKGKLIEDELEMVKIDLARLLGLVS